MLSLLAACSYSSVYDEFKSIDEGNWHYKDTLNFEVDIQDTAKMCNFNLVFRHDNDYHYSNFISFVRLEFPNGRARLDTVEIVLASRSGKWLGQGVGDIYSHERRYLSNMRFPMKGKYKFSILHAMRDELLEGVNDVGIAVRKSDQDQ